MKVTYAVARLSSRSGLKLVAHPKCPGAADGSVAGYKEIKDSQTQVQ
jgi:hypothetical protein